jgi:hypothetical protein
LTESKAAKDASKQIERNTKKSEEDSKKEDELIINEREKLIEQQSVMAQKHLRLKLQSFEKSSDISNRRQEKLRKLDQMVQTARASIFRRS